MACQCHLGSSSPFLNANPRPSIRRTKFRIYPSITSQFSNPTTANAGDDDDSNGGTKTPATNGRSDLLKLSATMIVISAALPQPKPAVAAVKERRRGAKKPAAKKAEALSPQELKSWTQGLPPVSRRIPYSEVLELKEQGKLKHVIKPPGVDLRQSSETVLVVMEDSRVARTVLPSVASDKGFWQSWSELSLDSLCINAYTPPMKRPEVPSPFLGFLGRVPEWMVSMVGPKKESKKAAELRRAREALKRERKGELERMRKESEMIENAVKNQRKEEERRLRREARKKKHQSSLRQARRDYQEMATMWADLAQDQNVATALGFLFFYIFYRVVVLNYRKQKRDYEDRIKIEKAEAEERKKMRELEREMEGIEAGGDDEGEAEQGKGEDNPYMKMATQFMKSGARVRRAQNRRLPQYLERGVDVKFEDVAGLGKIRLELEEIVKFFTHGEMYRRRGVKIPG